MPITQTTIPTAFAAATSATGAQLDANFNSLAAAMNSPLQPSNYLLDTGSANTYAVAFGTGIVPTYTAGLMIQMLVLHSNTGASTLNVSSLGAKNILVGGSALSNGQMVAGNIVVLQYDGTQFQLVSSYNSVNATNATNLSGGTVNATTISASGSSTLLGATITNIGGIYLTSLNGNTTFTGTIGIGTSSGAAGNMLYFTPSGYAHEFRVNNVAKVQIDSTGITSTGLFTSNGQIAFPATQNPSADANTLDDYEEGTWTPVLAFGGTSTGITYGTQLGSYTKIGRLVTVFMVITLTSKGSSVGVARITGLPFTLPNLNVSNSPTPLFTWNQMNTALYSLFGTPGANTDYISVMKITAATTSSFGSTAADTDFTNTSSLWLSFSYQV